MLQETGWLCNSVYVTQHTEFRHQVNVLCVIHSWEPLMVSFLFPFLFLTVRTTEAAVAYWTPELPHGTAEICWIASPTANGTAAAWAEPSAGTPALRRTWPGTTWSNGAPWHDASSAAPSLPSHAPPDATTSSTPARWEARSAHRQDWGHPCGTGWKELTTPLVICD